MVCVVQRQEPRTAGRQQDQRRGQPRGNEDVCGIAFEGSQVDVIFRGTLDGRQVQGNAEYRTAGDTGSFPSRENVLVERRRDQVASVACHSLVWREGRASPDADPHSLGSHAALQRRRESNQPQKPRGHRVSAVNARRTRRTWTPGTPPDPGLQILVSSLSCSLISVPL